jgi:Rrf2 family transcriptional regulator, cysteine metabolism repressor
MSARAKYACLALIALAHREGDATPMSTREIAHDSGVPKPFLATILVQLRSAGLVSSSQGQAGGYRLSRPAERISLAEVLTLVDGPQHEDCESGGPHARALASAIERARAAEQAVLKSTSLAELAGRSLPLNWVI